MSHHVTDAARAHLDSIVAALRQLTPADRIKVGAEVSDAILDGLEHVAAARAEAARQLRREGWTYREIGDACGFTAQRAHKLARGMGDTRQRSERLAAAGAAQ